MMNTTTQQQITVQVSPDLLHQFETATAAHGKDMTAVLADFMRLYVQGSEEEAVDTLLFDERSQEPDGRDLASVLQAHGRVHV